VAPRLDHARPPLAPPNRRAPSPASRRRHASLPAAVRPAAADHTTQPCDAPTSAAERSPLRDRGVGLLAVFTAAMLVMVALAVVVGMHNSLWILVPVMAVDFVLTAIVLLMVVRLLDDGE
jgi:hypothetical protein